MSQSFSSAPRRIDVFPIPDLIPVGYRPTAAVFIDVLRATSTIVTALSAGAEQVIPVMEPGQALKMKELLEKSDPAKRGNILLGGERNAVLIAGFDLGNSPASYTPERVGGKTILFSTTNGTRAILTFERVSGTAPVTEAEKNRRERGPSVGQGMLTIPTHARTRSFIASFLNARALVEKLRPFDSVGIVCAGTELHYTEEDTLLAGLIVSRLLRAAEEVPGLPRPLLNVQAETAGYLWESFLETVTPETLEKHLCERLVASRGGEHLRRVNLLSDLRDAARLDRLETVPEYCLGSIRPVLDGAD